MAKHPKTIRLYSLTLGLLLVAIVSIFAAGSAEPIPEKNMTGLWVVRYNLATRESIDQVIAASSAAGITDLFAQVCGRAEAYYRSEKLPPAPGIELGFDPLGYLLDQAHNRGIRVHAWINAYTAADWSRRPDSPTHVLNSHPEWVQVDKTGRTLLDYPGEPSIDVPAIFLDPGAPGVQDFVVGIVEEVAELYPVDGIHLDYIRYPSPEYGFSTGSRTSFQQVSGWDPLVRKVASDPQWDEWRKNQVTAAVLAIQDSLSGDGREVLLSAAVIFDPVKAKDKHFQDWIGWLDSGIMDFVVPMVYLDDPAAFRTALLTIRETAGFERVYPGLGAYKLTDDPRSLFDQVELALDWDFSGVVFFEYRTMAEAAIFSQLRMVWPKGI